MLHLFKKTANVQLDFLKLDHLVHRHHRDHIFAIFVLHLRKLRQLVCRLLRYGLVCVVSGVVLLLRKYFRDRYLRTDSQMPDFYDVLFDALHSVSRG
ncbi:hypothetical protein D3C73_1487570 [compost metagenome]